MIYTRFVSRVQVSVIADIPKRLQLSFDCVALWLSTSFLVDGHVRHHGDSNVTGRTWYLRHVPHVVYTSAVNVVEVAFGLVCFVRCKKGEEDLSRHARYCKYSDGLKFNVRVACRTTDEGSAASCAHLRDAHKRLR